MNSEIKKLTEDFFALIPLELKSVEVEEITPNEFKIKAVSEESALIIGTQGAHFSAFNHLIRRFFAKKYGEDFKISFDVNGYREKVEGDLKKQFLVLVERARSLRANVEMSPASSYERMLIHSLAGEFKDIKTESIGEGRERRVVIKYIG